MGRRNRSAAPVRLSLAEARGLAVGAQGLGGPRLNAKAAAGRGSVRALVERLSAVQIDSVNVLVRSHYLPVFSRLGPYDPADLEQLAYAAPRKLFEYWGHEASLLPVGLQPSLRFRMEEARDHSWPGLRRIVREQPGLIRDVLALVAERGPVGAGEIELGERSRAPGWWGWSDAKRAIEYLFWSGQVTTARRRGFERLYDLPERVLPARICRAPTPKPADAYRELIERAARAIGVGTEADLRDYFRLRPEAGRPAIAALVESGILLPAEVEGWKQPAFLHARAAVPGVDLHRGALLSPFDSLIWTRDRTERLFGMRFRLEIYTPREKRVHGYYVLPFLLGDRLAARVDLKADRAAGTLIVQAAHLEPRASSSRVAEALAEELLLLASWLRLPRVVMRRGRGRG